MKSTFYTLSRMPERLTYLKREGEKVTIPDCPFFLSIYKGTEIVSPIDGDKKEERKCWYVVEERCGLSIGKGFTKKEAIADAADNIRKIPLKNLEETIQKSIKQHGGTPDHRAVYLHGEEMPPQW